MDLVGALGIGERDGRFPLIAAFVGAGGKTSAIFALADAAADFGVTITTTTHIRDPRLEKGRRFDRVLIDPELARQRRYPSMPPHRFASSRGAPPLIVASGVIAEEGKLVGIYPERADEIAAQCDILLVEADGSRGRPIKAPAAQEPVIPPRSAIVVGLVGLDCLGAPLCAATAHRPELLTGITGCTEGETIEAGHIAALIRSPRGLFSKCPPGSRRVVLLNKAELLSPGRIFALLDLIKQNPGSADMVIACSLAGRKIFETMNLKSTNTKSRKEGGAP